MTEAKNFRAETCAQLIRDYRSAAGEQKATIREKLDGMLYKGIYASRRPPHRSYRVHGIVEEKGEFLVEYSPEKGGMMNRIPLLRAIEHLEDKEVQYICRDLA